MRMTKTAQANRELRQQKAIEDAKRRTESDIAEKNRRSQQEIATKDRKSKEDIAAKDRGQKDRQAFLNFGSGTVSSLGALLRGLAAITGSNDPAWYFKIPGVKETLNYPTYNVLGYAGKYGTRTRPLPTVMSIKYLNTWGIGELGSHAGNHAEYPINRAFSWLLTSLRSRNSRIGQYEPGDLGQTLVAGCDVFVQLLRLAKALGFAYKYQHSKLKLGNALITACGFNAVDFRAHLADYKTFYNSQASMANSALCLPKDIAYFSRKLFMASAVYADDELSESQIYVFTPDTYLVYDEANAVVTQSQFSGQTYAQFIAMSNSQLDALVYSATLLTMWADIRGAYDEKDFIQLAPIDTVFELQIPVVHEVLHQIMNALPLISGQGANDSVSTFDFELRQDSDGLVYSNQVITWDSMDQDEAGCLETVFNQLNCHRLNFYKDAPTTDDLMVATRLHPSYIVRKLSATSIELYIDISGTEVISEMAIYVYDDNSSSFVESGVTLINTTGDKTDEDVNIIIENYSSFDWKPFATFCPNVLFQDGFDGTQSITPIQWGNNFQLEVNALEKLHSVAIQSEFFISVPTSWH